MERGDLGQHARHVSRRPRMLSEDGNRELGSLEALLDALGFRLSVETKATG